MGFLTHVKMLALDVDGVLTDGIIYYSPSGDAMKGFSARDGMGISPGPGSRLEDGFGYGSPFTHG